MRVPISWLREFAALPNDAGEIADRLAMLGFPVAGIEKRPQITGAITGRIAELEKHPNADRLQVARVDVGVDSPLTIVTAAANVAPGQCIAVATVGAHLPELTIEPRTMRGVVSQGMMISAEELALPGEWFEDGILQLEPSTPPGRNAVEFYGLDTDVLDVEITANRPDAMSVTGLARELAASYGIALQLPPALNPGTQSEPSGKTPRVSLESADCRRYVAQRFDGVRVTDAPAWMRIRLALSGQRPINNLVDVSNYVMLETGQPLHFYDADQIHDGGLIVRAARDGESVVTLDGVRRSLSPNVLVIADDTRVLCLAGLMGGAIGEVTPTTTAIVLEAANFNGTRIRRASTALGLRSEASARHEKSLAPALTEIGAARAAQLLGQFGATAYRPHCFGAPIVAAQPIALPIGEVERLLGLSLSEERAQRHLGALGCRVEAGRDGVLSVTPPPWRRDLTIVADLVEEVARIEGYDRIEPVVPSVPSHEISSAEFDREQQIAAALAALGYREIITYSLQGRTHEERMHRAGFPTNRGQVEVRNPLSEEQRLLRESLWPGLLEYFATIAEPARVFEIGDVFARDGNDVVERTALAFGFSVDRSAEPARHDSSFLRLKGDCEALLRQVTGRHSDVMRGGEPGFHPGKTAILTQAGRKLGLLGCIDPRLTKAYDLKRSVYCCLLDVAALPPYQTPHYRPPSRFPSTYRDVALVVDVGVSARELERTIADVLGALCTGVNVFDEYRGAQVADGSKSLAVRITLQRFDATITDQQADDAIARVLEAVRERFGATIRT
jgi:phenylalanyl-tRNA synthetase beta chain